MRALFTSTRGAGHFNPLIPFARAFERAGHEVMFAGPPDLEGPVESAGFRFFEFDSPPDDELGPVWARVPELPPDEANVVVIVADEKVGLVRRKVRSTHIYAHNAELVIDAYAPPGDFAAADREAFQPLVRSVRLTQPPRARS